MLDREPRVESAAGPDAAYSALIAQGALTPDPAQAHAVAALQRLHDDLIDYTPAAPPNPSGGWLSRLFGVARNDDARTGPRGLYIHGDVGRGKSMLMDLFFDGAPVTRKRRVHFHAFMLEVHRTIHDWRQAARAGGADADDPIPPLSGRIAADTTLICFDEFHVTDIADAMILSRLFTALFAAGVVVVATSNWPPELLYTHGLQRDSFLPFIDLVRARCDIIELKAAKDYRLARMIGQPVYFVPLGPKADQALADAFARLTDDAAGEPVTLTVDGRALPVACHAKGVARVDYDGLCRRPRGAADFIALCETFHVLVLSGVPRLPTDRLDETKRFMLLIDTLYEHSTKLVMAADAPPQDLYRGKLLAFEFRRTDSRLNEMQSAEYWRDVSR